MIEKHPEPEMGTEGDVLGKRIAATILDFVALFVLMFGGILVVRVFAEIAAILAIAAVFGLFAAFLYFLYFMEGGFGRTPGKAAMGLVVVKEDGSQCGYGASFVRNFLWIVDGFGIWPFIVALIVFITDRNQRVGDMVASTVVVAAKR